MHRLGDEHHAYAWDRGTPPALTVAPEDVVELAARDASDGQIDSTSTDADVAELDDTRANPITGPVAVDGAQPGDTLVVHVEDVAVDTWGWTAVIPDLERDGQLRTPHLTIPAEDAALGGRHATTGIGPDLYEAAREATRAMVEWLAGHHDLAPVDAYLLCSTIADLRIREVVDEPNWVVSLDLPLAVLDA